MIKIMAFFTKWLFFPTLLLIVLAMSPSNIAIWLFLVITFGWCVSGINSIVKKELTNRGEKQFWESISFSSSKIDYLVSVVIAFIFGIISVFLF
ncbi:hypothetical protein [Natronospora cellulosivora (SeqCode)]